MAQLSLADAINRFPANESRIDTFVNGDIEDSYLTPSGVEVPSIANFLNEKSEIIDNLTNELGESDGAQKIGYGQRTVSAKLQEINSLKDQNAFGDGVTNDNAAMIAAKAAIDTGVPAMLNMSGGRYKTTGTFWPNNVSPTMMYFDKPSVLGLFDGTNANPNSVDNDPALWVQKYTRYDSGTDSYAHNVGGVFGSVIVKGSGTTANDTDGTWIGVLGQSIMDGVNQGTDVAPNYDAAGNVIGVAGFARMNGDPGNGKIACGVWGYPEGPTLTQTQWNSLPNNNWSLCAIEANIQQNHPDIGERADLSGKGSSVGLLLHNYRTPGTGVKNWSFGIILSGPPDNNNYSDPSIDNRQGFWTGILIDNIKAKGIRFGQYFKNGSYGIHFPSSYPGDRPSAAMYVGDNVINWAQYTGATFNNGDMWANGGTLYYRKAGVNRTVVLNGDGAFRQTATAVGINTDPAFQLDVTDETTAAAAVTAYGSAGNLTLRAASGTKAVAGALAADAGIGFIGARGHNGATFGGNAAAIGMYAAEAWTASNNGTYITLATTQKGTTTRLEGVRLTDVGDLLIQRIGAGLRVKEGANAKQGVATLVAGTVTVPNTSITANSRVQLTAQDNNTTGACRVSGRVAGASFTITSNNAADSGVVAYQIFEPA